MKLVKNFILQCWWWNWGNTHNCSKGNQRMREEQKIHKDSISISQLEKLSLKSTEYYRDNIGLDP